MNPDHAALIALVERSPAAVAIHDRNAWLGLFTDDAVVEDPVGSAPAPKRDGTLARFWDTFIAPHGIRFEIRRDHVIGRDVFRDALIHTRVREGVNVIVPAYLLYQCTDDAKNARRMAAHWTLARMTVVAMSMGPRAWIAMTGLFARMIGVMGLGWVGAYLASLWRGIGGAGKRAVDALAAAIAVRDVARVVSLFSSDGFVELGERRIAPRDLFALLPANATLRFDALVTAGWTSSFRFTLAGANDDGAGQARFEVDRASKRIARARFFAPV